MARIVWDADSEKRFETGVDHGVLYVKRPKATKVFAASTSYKKGEYFIAATETSGTYAVAKALKDFTTGSSESSIDTTLTFEDRYVIAYTGSYTTDLPTTELGTPITELGSGVTTFYETGIAWNGLTSVSKSPSGAEANDIYADNIKYASLRSAETFGATIEAYTYPNEFAQCNGLDETENGLYLGQQMRKSFGFCFRTDIGDDSDNGIDVNDKYKLHIIYNATASPSEESFSTINDSPEAITFSWEISTIPVEAGTGYLPTAILTIDKSLLTTKGLSKLATLEQVLYGTNGTEPRLPNPKDVIDFFKAAA
jgi:hypothetical protein